MLDTGKRTWTCRDGCLSEVNTACLVRMVRLVRCGDDFSLSGRRSPVTSWEKHLLVKKTAVMGPNVGMGDVQEAIHLNRLLRLYPPGAEGGERWELEADLRRVGNPGVTDGTKQPKAKL